MHDIKLVADCQVSLHDREDLIESDIWPGMEEAQEGLLELFEEMEGQLDKEVDRLVALANVRQEDPGEMTR